ARLQGAPSILEHRGELLRVLPADLGEVPKHVADRREAVLDVVVHLPGQVADGGTTLYLTQPGGADSKPLGHGAKQPGERADLVGAIAVEALIQAVEVDLRGLPRQV